MKMNSDKRKELKIMYSQLPYCYRGKGEYLLPVSQEERKARRLIKQIEARRHARLETMGRKFEAAKQEARRAIFLFDDFRAALRAIEKAQSLAGKR